MMPKVVQVVEEDVVIVTGIVVVVTETETEIGIEDDATDDIERITHLDLSLFHLFACSLFFFCNNILLTMLDLIFVGLVVYSFFEKK